jgi:hypothetical protein
MHVAIS